MPDQALDSPPGYVDHVDVNRTTARLSVDLKGTATGTAADSELLDAEYRPLIVVALRDTNNDSDAGIAFTRDTTLSGSDPYAYTPVNETEAKVWLTALTASSTIEVAVLNTNRRCTTDPLNTCLLYTSPSPRD